MAQAVDQVPVFPELTEAMQTAGGIANDAADGHKMLAKLQQGLTRIQVAWAAFVAGATPITLAAMEKFIIVEKYPGGSRRRRQSKKRRNQRNHNNNNQ